MTYNVVKNDKTILYIGNSTVDTQTASIALFGQNLVNYGQLFNQNYVNLIQNFADDSAPPTPSVGQLWYDTKTLQLKLYNSILWETITPTFNGSAGNLIYALPSSPTSTVILTFAESKIISATSYIAVDAIYIPNAISFNSVEYEFKSVFPNGLQAGLTLAQYSNVLLTFNSVTASANVLTVPKTISFTNSFVGSDLFDGSSNVNVAVSFSNVYIGNSNISVAGSYSNVTVDHTGKIVNVGNITFTDVVSALGYVPFTDSNVSVNSQPNNVVLRDANGSFSTNVITGTVTHAQQFTSNVSIMLTGNINGTSNLFNGTSNLVINTNLSYIGNLTPDTYNSVTVNNTGLITGGSLIQNMPVGAIILYNNIFVPEGWAKCDGNTVVSPNNVTVTTPNYSNALVGGTFYIMKVYDDIYLPSNDPIIGSISVNLVNGSVPMINFIGGPLIKYPPIVWSNVNVASSSSTFNTNNFTKINTVKKKSAGRQYAIDDELEIDLPNFSKKYTEKATIKVSSVDSSGGIINFILQSQGKYRIVPDSGEIGTFVSVTNSAKPVDRVNSNGYSPVGLPNKNDKWLGLAGFTNNTPKVKNRLHSTDPNDNATFDIVVDNQTIDMSVVQDINLDDSLFFDATALVLTNGDSNAVMLSQVNLYGDLSQLTIAQVMKNLENRTFSGLPPRLGKYMLHYNDIVNYAGILQCPVDKTFFTIAVQNRMMYLFVVDVANRFSNDGFYPTDEKLFGAAYIGYTRYIALLKSTKTKTVGTVLEEANLKRTQLNEIDDLTVDVFLQYISKMITNAKVAVSNNKIAIELAETSNKLNKTSIAVPKTLIPKPLLTTGNVSIVLSEVLIDNIPAVVGGVRSEIPMLGGGSYARISLPVNDAVFNSINDQRFNKPGTPDYNSNNNNDSSDYSYNSGTGGGKGGAPASVNPSNSNIKNGTGSYTGGAVASGPGMTYQSGNGGWYDAYLNSESNNSAVWNTNGAQAYRDYWGKSLPDPLSLTVGEVISIQADINIAVEELGRPQASSAVGPAQMVRKTFIRALDNLGITYDTPYSQVVNSTKNQTLIDHVADFANQTGKNILDITQSEANLALRYGAAGAAALITAAPGETVGQVIARTGFGGLLNNGVCTPQGPATPALDVNKYCSDYSNLPQPSASAILSNVPSKPLTDMTGAELLPPQTTSATAAAAVVSQKVVVTVLDEVVKAGGLTIPALLDLVNNAIEKSTVQPPPVKPAAAVGGTTVTPAKPGLLIGRDTPPTVNSIGTNLNMGSKYVPFTGQTVTVSKPGGDFIVAPSKPLSFSSSSTDGKSASSGVQSSGASLSFGSSVSKPSASSGSTATYSMGTPVNKPTTGGSGSSTATGGGAGNTGGAFSLKGCFVFDTLIDMADGTVKKIGELKLGDNTTGGEVVATHCYNGAPLYDYLGVHVSGTHYVIEHGLPVMVQDTAHAFKIDDVYGLYTVDTAGRRIFVNGIEFADHNGDGVIFDFFENANRTSFESVEDIYREVLEQIKNAKL